MTRSIGDTHDATSNSHAARDAWQHALTILDDLNHPDAENLRTRLKTFDTQLRTDDVRGHQ